MDEHTGQASKTRDELVEELMEKEDLDQIEAEKRADEILSKKENTE